ncbi:MAG: GNAT family N-acetyltransferase [Alphaproteobacteria bacterium]
MERIRPIAGAWLACYARLLLDLDSLDRRLRFGRPAGDDLVRRHVEAAAAGGVLVLAAFGQGRVVGAAEIARSGDAVEVALAVERPMRRRGLGHRLLGAALVAASGREVRLHMLAENRAARTLAARAGFALRQLGTEIAAVRHLEPVPGRPSLGAA